MPQLLLICELLAWRASRQPAASGRRPVQHRLRLTGSPRDLSAASASSLPSPAIAAPISQLSGTPVLRGGRKYAATEPRIALQTLAQLLRRTFAVDVETCPRCGGRMRLLALVTDPQSVARFLRHLGEPTTPPVRAPTRDPPFFQSRVRRCRHDEPSPQMPLFNEH